MKRIFTRVDYPQFRHFMDTMVAGKISHKGYETAVYDHLGDIQALVHAASIDEKGNVYPAQYYVKASSLVEVVAAAA